MPRTKMPAAQIRRRPVCIKTPEEKLNAPSVGELGIKDENIFVNVSELPPEDEKIELQQAKNKRPAEDDSILFSEKALQDLTGYDKYGPGCSKMKIIKSIKNEAEVSEEPAPGDETEVREEPGPGDETEEEPAPRDETEVREEPAPGIKTEIREEPASGDKTEVREEHASGVKTDVREEPAPCVKTEEPAPGDETEVRKLAKNDDKSCETHMRRKSTRNIERKNYAELNSANNSENEDAPEELAFKEEKPKNKRKLHEARNSSEDEAWEPEVVKKCPGKRGKSLKNKSDKGADDGMDKPGCSYESKEERKSTRILERKSYKEIDSDDSENDEKKPKDISEDKQED